MEGTFGAYAVLVLEPEVRRMEVSHEGTLETPTDKCIWLGVASEEESVQLEVSLIFLFLCWC